jgi:hypothetical protein
VTGADTTAVSRKATDSLGRDGWRDIGFLCEPGDDAS